MSGFSIWGIETERLQLAPRVKAERRAAMDARDIALKRLEIASSLLQGFQQRPFRREPGRRCCNVVRNRLQSREIFEP